MKAHLACIPCLLRQALDAIKMSSPDVAIRDRAVRQVLNYISNTQWDKTTPELATNVHRIIKKVTGSSDPYSQLKKKYTLAVLKLYPELAAVVETAKELYSLQLSLLLPETL